FHVALRRSETMKSLEFRLQAVSLDDPRQPPEGGTPNDFLRSRTCRSMRRPETMKIRRWPRVLAGRLRHKTCPPGRGRTIFGGVTDGEYRSILGKTGKDRSILQRIGPSALQSRGD